MMHNVSLVLWSHNHIIQVKLHRSFLVLWSTNHVKNDDVIKWKHFPRYWPFVPVIHRSPVNSLHKGQWRGALMFCLICAWITGWVNNREACDLRRHCADYDVTIMSVSNCSTHHQDSIQVCLLCDAMHAPRSPSLSDNILIQNKDYCQYMYNIVWN